jgi:hypothetical protein
MRRKLTLGLAMVAAVAMPATLAVTTSGGSAFASGSQISCTKLKGTETGSDKLSGCSGPSAIVGSKAGKGTAVSTADITTSTEVTVWGKKGVGGTDDSSYTYTIVSPNTLCSKKDIQVVESSTVTSGSGPAAALIGDTGSSTVCVTSKGGVSNMKGTDVTT